MKGKKVLHYQLISGLSSKAYFFMKPLVWLLPLQTVFLPKVPPALPLVVCIWKASSRESSAEQHRLT